MVVNFSTGCDLQFCGSFFEVVYAHSAHEATLAPLPLETRCESSTPHYKLRLLLLLLVGGFMVAFVHTAYANLERA
jgi:hypothetical protein